MVVDVISFCGELDVLDIRLNILDKAVDEFIICESDYTFTGLPKPRYFEKNKERYAPFLHKIKYFLMASDDAVLQREANNSPGVPQDLHWWRREFTQKESMRYALTHLKDTDTVFIGDADEIWNPEYMPPLDRRSKLEQTVYAYYLNNRSSEWWEGTSVMPYGMIRTNTLDNLRAHDAHREHAPTFANHGWHFTNMGGRDFIQRKLASYSHQEFNTDTVLSQLEERMKQKKDFIGRDFIFTIDDSGLSPYILENKGKYSHLWYTGE
jgi:hypothetical protein